MKPYAVTRREVNDAFEQLLQESTEPLTINWALRTLAQITGAGVPLSVVDSSPLGIAEGNRWVPVDDWYTIRANQLVELRNGIRRVRGHRRFVTGSRVAGDTHGEGLDFHDLPDPADSETSWSGYWMRADGWVAFVQRKDMQ